MFKCLWVCGRRIMRNVGSGEVVSAKRVHVNPKEKYLYVFFG